MPDHDDPAGRNDVTLPAPPGSGLVEMSARTTVDGLSRPGAATSQPRLDAYIGKTLDGRYFVEQLLGEGGMGVVYRGRHKVIDKRVAIKILRGDMASDAEMADRFLNEARAASSIGNAHIVDISDFGRVEGATYFVMEYLDGTNLAKALSSHRFIPILRLLHIAKQIARGLDAAHARGIIHRDLKPDNVMLVVRGDDRDFVKVLDFGIAKVSGETGRLTRTGRIFGTPHYMSPEQAAGFSVDRRTDIYSLGVILYEMACGKVPFDAENFMGILTQHVYKAPLPLRSVTPRLQEIPTGFEAVVMKCLSKKVELRYQTMEELAADLEKLERGIAPTAAAELTSGAGFDVPEDYFQKRGAAPAVSAPMAPVPTPTRGPLPAIVASLVILSLAVAGIFAFRVLRAPTESGTSAGPSAATELASISPPEGSAGTAPMVVSETKTLIVITADPADALISLNNGPLKTAPASVSLGAKDTVNVHVERKGYVAQSFALKASDIPDPKNPFKAVKLERVPPPPPASAKKPAAPPPPPAKTVTTGPCPPGPNGKELMRDPFDGKCH